MTDNDKGSSRIATEEDSVRSTRAVVVPSSRTDNNSVWSSPSPPPTLPPPLSQSPCSSLVTRPTNNNNNNNPFLSSIHERDACDGSSRFGNTMNHNDNAVKHNASNINSLHWSLMLPPPYTANSTFIQTNYSLCRQHNWRLTLNNYQNCNTLRDTIIDYAKYPCICNISKNPYCSWNVYPVATIVNKIKEKNTECLLLLRQLLDFYESMNESAIRQPTFPRINPFLPAGFMDYETIETAATTDNNNAIVSSTAETNGLLDILRNPLPIPPFLHPDVVSDQSIKRTPFAVHSYVYAVFRFEDLSVMRLHNGPWRKFSTNGETSTSGTNSNGGGGGSNTSIVLEQYLSCCCHCTKFKKHVILCGWYVARRLKSGFSQCLREKQKQKKSLTFLKSFEYNGGTISLTNVLCTCLKADFPKFCFNVQGNILYASTVDIRNLSEDNLPNDEHVLRLVERILEENTSYHTVTMNSNNIINNNNNINNNYSINRGMTTNASGQHRTPDSSDDTNNCLNDTHPSATPHLLHHHFLHHYHTNGPVINKQSIDSPPFIDVTNLDPIDPEEHVSSM